MNILELRKAIQEKNHSSVYDLVADRDVDINTTGLRTGWTALQIAVQLGDSKITEIFLKMGANPNAKVAQAAPPLFIAILQAGCYENESVQFQEYIKIIELLLKYGAHQIQKSNDWTTPLHLAALLGNIPCIDLLMKHGFDPKVKSLRGLTPIDYAKETDFRISLVKVIKFEKLTETQKLLCNVTSQKNINHTLHALHYLPVSYFLVLSKASEAAGFRLPNEIMRKIVYFIFCQKIMDYDTSSTKDGIYRAAEENNMEKLNGALNNYAFDDRGYSISSPMELAIQNNNLPMAELLAKNYSIFSDSRTFGKCQSEEMRQLLIQVKRGQLRILKEELHLENKDPEEAVLFAN